MNTNLDSKSKLA